MITIMKNYPKVLQSMTPHNDDLSIVLLKLCYLQLPLGTEFNLVCHSRKSNHDFN